MNGKLLKILGVTTSVLGFAISLVENVVSEKKLDNKVKEEVDKAIKNLKN